MKKKKFHSTLWSFVLSPVTWATYMTVTYIILAIWCAKSGREASLDDVKGVIGVLTAAALLIIGHQMVRNFRRHSLGHAQLPHNESTPMDRERFLGFAGFLISSLSAVAVLFIAFNMIIFRSCQ